MREEDMSVAGSSNAAGRPVRCVVAGGSLVGLSAAIALSRLGMDVTVLERSPARAVDGGGGLGVDVTLLRQVTGIGEEPPVLHGIDRDTTAWHLLQGWLEEHAVRRPGVTVHRGTQVTAVDPGSDQQPASVVTQDGGEHGADLVIGADGARSTVRATVEPEFPDARYAGVLLWRTLVDEQAMPAAVALPSPRELSREIYAGPYRLVTYLVPGAAGETAVGHRRLNMVWYDPQQRDLLRDTGLLDGEIIHGSLVLGALPARSASASPRSPPRTGRARGARHWPLRCTGNRVRHPARALRAQAAGPRPGRTAPAAAHAASPMVGGEFGAGLYDVDALDGRRP